MSLFAIRPANLDDIPLVVDSFWRDFKRSVYAEDMTVAAMRSLIIEVIGRENWKTVIAEMTDVPGEIYGWLVYRSAREVAWCYVKPRYRKHGCARALLAHAGVKPGRVSCAFLDPRTDDIARPRGYRLLFRPFMTAVTG